MHAAAHECKQISGRLVVEDEETIKSLSPSRSNQEYVLRPSDNQYLHITSVDRPQIRVSYPGTDRYKMIDVTYLLIVKQK